MIAPSIPPSQHALVSGNLIDKRWHDFFRRLAETASSLPVTPTPPVSPDVTIYSTATILASGNAQDGYRFFLSTVPDSGTGALRGITRDGYGRIIGTTDATITGTTGEIDVADGDAIAGPPTLSLADVADSGTGTLQKTDFDAKGRKTGTAAATTDDLTEGATNLYHTTERAQDAVGAAIAAGTGDGVALTYDDAGNAINATNTDKGSAAVSAHEAAANPHPQYALAASLAGSAGASLVGFLQSGTGAVTRTLQDKGRDVVSDADFDTAAHAATEAASKPIIYNMLHGDAGRKYRMIACIIRQDSNGSGWYFIDDGTNHKPVGVTSLTSNADGTLTLTYNFTANYVGSINITPDEGFGATDLDVGMSAARSYTILTFYAPFEARLSNLTVAWGNYITTSGGFSVDTSTAATDGKVVFTHPAVTHTDSVGTAVTIEKYTPTGTSNGNAEIIVYAQSKTSFTLQAMEPISGKIAINGAGVITVTTELVTAPTATWNVSTNRLDVTHARSTSVNGFSVTPCTSGYRPVVAANSDTTLNIEFYDVAGVKYTGATAPASTTITFMRPGNDAGLWSAQNRLVIRRAGKCKVRAQDVSGAGNNWWVFGAHSVG